MAAYKKKETKDRGRETGRSMNDNSVYIIKCSDSNFDDAQYLARMFCRIIEVDNSGLCIKTHSLDSTIKQRLDEIGASFWQERAPAAVAVRRKGRRA